MTKRKTTNPQFNREFRETAVKLALAGDKPIAQVAREMDIPEKSLYAWVNSWKKRNQKISQKATASSAERLKQLEKRNKELEMENEILKKAAAYFAKTLL